VHTVLATPFTPTLDSGRARRTYGLARALAAHGPLDLVYGAFSAERPDPAYEEVSGVRLHRVERPSTLARLPAYVRARVGGVPDDFARGIWPDLVSVTSSLAREPDTRVVAEGPIAAAALLPLAARRPLVYSAHNLESSFRHRLDDTRLTRKQLERFERILLQRFAESWMVSDAEIEGARALVPAARLRLAPNVLDVDAIDPIPPRAGERSVLFLADFQYEPNRSGARFLLEEAMPALWAKAPDATLTIAGRESDRLAAPDERVTIAGFVENLPRLYAAAGCAAVPLLEGGGSPLKFVEALAYGLPVVATPRAAAGLRVRPGVDYFDAAPEAEEYAAGLLAALDPARANPVAAAGRRLAEREYSIEALSELLAPASQADRPTGHR
jgi:glycosyltransferase involved in cell wall biosynthesis